MILLDTNIISTFAKIGKMGLLYKVFNAPKFFISPNVHSEILKASSKGYSFADKVLELMHSKKLEIIPLSNRESEAIGRLPISLSSGERDSIIICKERKWVLLTNERKVINYCKKHGIAYFDLLDILHASYKLLDYS